MLTNINKINDIFNTLALLKHNFKVKSSSAISKSVLVVLVLSTIKKSNLSRKGIFILLRKSKAFLYSFDGFIYELIVIFSKFSSLLNPHLSNLKEG